ncbi:MAG TPA: hypothetical protein VJ583_03470 [Nitrososphaeraceae archaeon]|nr:hypothetical protein [Nitrososphaeraceae archaeon]
MDKTLSLEEAERELKKLSVRLSRQIFHQATPQHGNKTRGVGITRKNKSKSSKNLKIEKNSRKKNAQILKKVKRATGSKKRK